MFLTVPHIMAHSGMFAAQILNHFAIDPAKVRVIYPPLDTEQYYPAQPTLVSRTRSELGISGSKVTLLLSPAVTSEKDWTN